MSVVQNFGLALCGQRGCGGKGGDVRPSWGSLSAVRDSSCPDHSVQKPSYNLPPPVGLSRSPFSGMMFCPQERCRGSPLPGSSTCSRSTQVRFAL